MDENATKKRPARGPSLDERCEAEEQRLRGILTRCELPALRLEMLEPVLINTAWMRVKLDDARKTIRGGRVVLKYDNGGGQKGSHANPAYAEYRALFASYLKGLETLLGALPEELSGEKVAVDDSVLKLVLSQYGK